MLNARKLIHTTLAIAGLVFAATACSPQEIAVWTAWHEADPQAAEAFANNIGATKAVRRAAPEPAPSANATVETEPAEPGVHCYHLAGGTYCAVDGTDDAVDFAAQQADYYASHGMADPGPLPHSDYPIAPVFPEPAPAPTPDNVRCFILAGGTFCHPEGTAEYARAEQDEAEYLATHAYLVEDAEQ